MRLRSVNAFLLLCLSLAAGFGTVTAFLIGRECAREEQLRRMARLDADYAFIRVADNPGIHWAEQGREMILDGRLHDVVATKDSAGILLYLVIADDRETELLDRYLERSGNRDPSGKGYRMPVQNLFSSFWMQAQSGGELRPVVSLEACLTAFGPIALGKAPFLPVPVPPPLG